MQSPSPSSLAPVRLDSLNETPVGQQLAIGNKIKQQLAISADGSDTTTKDKKKWMDRLIDGRALTIDGAQGAQFFIKRFVSIRHVGFFFAA